MTDGAGTSSAPLAGELNEEQRFEVCIEAIRDCRIPLPACTLDDLMAINVPVRELDTAIKVLKGIADAQIMKDLLIQASRAGVMTDVFFPNLADIMRLCRWVRERQGQKVVNDLQKTAKLRKQGGGQLTVFEVGLLNALEQEMALLSNDQGRKRKKAERKLAELRSQIRQTEAELEAGLERSRQKYPSASSWKKPKDADLYSRCWEIFRREEFKKRGIAPVKTSITREKAKDLHLSEVIQQSKLEHCTLWFAARAV